jgi:hypothetical protein
MQGQMGWGHLLANLRRPGDLLGALGEADLSLGRLASSTGGFCTFLGRLYDDELRVIEQITQAPQGSSSLLVRVGGLVAPSGDGSAAPYVAGRIDATGGSVSLTPFGEKIADTARRYAGYLTNTQDPDHLYRHLSLDTSANEQTQGQHGVSVTEQGMMNSVIALAPDDWGKDSVECVFFVGLVYAVTRNDRGAVPFLVNANKFWGAYNMTPPPVGWATVGPRPGAQGWPPQPGDIVVFDKGRGHVAIVTEVARTADGDVTVQFVQANSTTPTDVLRVRHDGTVQLPPDMSAHSVQGFLRYTGT